MKETVRNLNNKENQYKSQARLFKEEKKLMLATIKDYERQTALISEENESLENERDLLSKAIKDIEL